jgi:hypothetical protein
LRPVPASDITLPAEALSAWVQDDELRWVDTDRRLHIVDLRLGLGLETGAVPGEYIWVR